MPTGSCSDSGILSKAPVIKMTLKTVKAQMAMKRLAIMPAAETITLARSLLRQRRGFTGVGLPHPISGIRATGPPMLPITKLAIGISKVPIGSM